VSVNVDGSTIGINASDQLYVPTGGITTIEIANGTIVDADISGSAGIAVTKLAAGGANQFLVNDGTSNVWAGLNLSSNFTGNGVGTALDLTNTGVTAGSYGNNTGTAYPYITVDAKGRITGVSTVSIAFPAETDPEVNMNITNAVPKWNGTQLVDGSISDDGTTVSVGSNFSVTVANGNTTTNGNLIVNGNTTLGDATTDVITIKGKIENSMGDLQVNDNVVPVSDNTYDLGSSSNRWNDIFLGGNILVDGYIQNPTGSVTVNDHLVVTLTSTLQGAVTAQNGISVTTGGVNIQNGGLTVQNGGAFIQTGNLIMGAGNIESSGSTVTINDNLSIPDGAGTVKLSYYGYTVPGSNNLTVNTGSYSVVTISSNNDGNDDNISLSGGTDGQILYVYFIGTDQINIAGESLISPINGRIGITLVYANSGWQIVGSYVY
jgi:hypothetical protein